MAHGLQRLYLKKKVAMALN